MEVLRTKILIEKTNISKMKGDYKAFNTIEKQSFLEALKTVRIDSRYSIIIKYVYDDTTMNIQIDEDSKTTNQREESHITHHFLRQPQKICLSMLKWDKVRLHIDENYLSQFRFVDYIILISSNRNDFNDRRC